LFPVIGVEWVSPKYASLLLLKQPRNTPPEKVEVIHDPENSATAVN